MEGRASVYREYSPSLSQFAVFKNDRIYRSLPVERGNHPTIIVYKRGPCVVLWSSVSPHTHSLLCHEKKLEYAKEEREREIIKPCFVLCLPFFKSLTQGEKSLIHRAAAVRREAWDGIGWRGERGIETNRATVWCCVTLRAGKRERGEDTASPVELTQLLLCLAFYRAITSLVEGQ
jgi:hypothetical protein